MSDFSSMLDDYFEGIENLKAGIIIEPEIIEVNNNNIIVDLNYKSEGIIPLKEIMETDSEFKYKVGDSINLFVESTDDGLGYPILSYNKASKIINFEEIQKSNSENHFIEVFVEKETPRGLVANFKGIECFIPHILCGVNKEDSLSSSSLLSLGPPPLGRCLDSFLPFSVCPLTSCPSISIWKATLASC